MSASLSDYDFELPRELIASRPLPDRAASRMMVVDRASGTISHRAFRELPEFMHPGDLLVLNNSRVIPARLLTDDGKIEILVFEKMPEGRWRAFT
ncbi:MAG: S-adenosylmethionine:tRNA ribosyltransferase-isomerase, partial [Chthoniobacterales bacterium]